MTILRLAIYLKNWSAFWHDFWHQPSTNELTTYHFRNGSVMIVRSGTDDKWGMTEAYLKRPYDHPDFNPLGDTPVIIDAGAHIGSFTVQTGFRLPKAHLFAIEPAQGTYDVLTSNIAANHLTNVTTIRGALTSRPGQITIHVDPAHSVFSSTIATPNNQSGPPELVPAWTLEKLLAAYHLPRIDWLKCDVEGSEFDIFLTLPPVVWQSLQNVSLEYHLFDPHHTLSELQNAFTQHDFEIIDLTSIRATIGLLKARRKKTA